MGFEKMVLLTLLICTLFGRGGASLVPALFVFGDSTVDSGNQNYITSVIKANYPPYGKDFVPPVPTGRFSNGKLANDFIAEYLGLPFPVNFLDPKASGSNLLTGVNLASSGSGFLDITGQIFGVLNLTRQLDNFGIVQANIIQQIGQAATANLIQDSIYLVSTGSNDFINNYNINPVLRAKYTPQQYEQVVLGVVAMNLKTLYGYGARKVLVDSLGPVGCIPQQLSLYQSKDGKCLEYINAPLRSFNKGLESTLAELRQEHPDYQLIYVNVYDTLNGAIQDPPSLGFKSGNTACCGEGPYKGLPCIDPLSDVCDNADDFVFWDLFHPSQHTYRIFADRIISGDPSQISPFNLQQII